MYSAWLPSSATTPYTNRSLPPKKKKNQENMANSNNQSGGDSIGGLIAILLFFGIIIFATAPGMLSMFLIKTGLGLELDGGQMWSFSVLFCLSYIGLLYLIIRDWNKIFLYYGIVSIGIIAFFLIAGYGFKAEFAENAWNLFF